MDYCKDLKKLEWYGHPKDFAIGKIFLEKFIAWYAFTGKMESWKKSRRTQAWKLFLFVV